MQTKKPAKPTKQDARITELEAQCAEYLAGWKRSQADYQNLNKRLSEERREAIQFGSANTLLRLLPAIDGLESAYGVVPTHLENDPWVKGIGYVRQLLTTTMQEIGLEEIPVEKAFDPALHEAVDEAEDATHIPGEIVRVVRKGYRMHGRVLRPAAVVIAKSKPS